MYNFISTFDELSKLYEEAPKVVSKKADDLCAVMLDGQQKYTGTREECENWLKDKTGPLASRFKIVQGADVPVIEALTEAAEDEEIEIVDDEVAVEEIPAEEPVVEDEPKQTIIECSKCGALVIVDEVEVDEESDLVNVKDECKFCEEKEGYKIIGSVLPYEAAEADEEEPVEEPVEDVVEESLNNSELLKEIEKTNELKTEHESEYLTLNEEANIVDEDLADVYRKTFDKPASINTQQAWEDRIVDLETQLEDPNLPASKKAKIRKEIARLETKFAQQRDWEARHANDDEELEELFDIKPAVSLSLDGGTGNDVSVLGH